MKTTEDLKAAKSTAGQGFTPSTKTQTASEQEPVSPAAPAEGQEFALQHSVAAERNLTTQVQAQLAQITSATEMLQNAATAIADIEEDIFSGNYFQRQLAEKRAQRVFSAVEDIPVSLEFEELTTLEAMARPAKFPSIQDTIKAISPAAKAELDKAVLSPAK